MVKTWSVHPGKSHASAIQQAADIIRQGGVVVAPTHGLYGLSGEAFNAETVQRIFHIKGRPTAKPVLVFIDDVEMLDRVACVPHKNVLRLMQHFWPGKVTFVLPAQPDLPQALTAGSGNIGVRMVAHPVTAALVRAAGAPLTGTSANVSGSGGCADIHQMDAEILAGVDGILDAGTLAGGPGSTIIDLTPPTPRVLREGAVPGKKILASYQAFVDGETSSELPY